MIMQNEDWRLWRLEHNGLTWRAALPKDVGWINDVIDDTEQHLRADQDRPDPFAFPILLTLVAEDAEGRIVDALEIELVADIRKLGLDRRSFSAWEKLLPVIGQFLQERRVRVAHISTRKRWARLMAPALRAMGFETTDGKITHWLRKV